MAPPSCPGQEVNHWHGMSQYLTRLQSLTSATQGALLVQLPTRRHNTSWRSMQSYLTRMSSTQTPLRQQARGTAWPLSWCKRSTDAITIVTQDDRETTFLFQRLSIAFQRRNAVPFSTRWSLNKFAEVFLGHPVQYSGNVVRVLALLLFLSHL